MSYDQGYDEYMADQAAADGHEQEMLQSMSDEGEAMAQIENDRADKLLRDAAPDLLAALEALVRALPNDEGLAMYVSELDMAERALKKARGGTK